MNLDESFWGELLQVPNIFFFFLSFYPGELDLSWLSVSRVALMNCQTLVFCSVKMAVNILAIV